MEIINSLEEGRWLSKTFLEEVGGLIDFGANKPNVV